MSEEFIYHLVRENDFKKCFKKNEYLTSNFNDDGFIHCSSKDSVIDIAQDYFSSISDLILLKIELKSLKSSVKFEAPVPLKGGDNTHIKEGLLCPHVYGSINEQSISGIAKMVNSNGKFEFPVEFRELSGFINKQK